VQLQALRPDLTVEGIRGNVDTRLRKLHDSDYDALMLAAAGMERLGLRERITEYLPVEQFVPDAGQGTITVQARLGSDACELARALDHRENRLAAEAERALVRALGAGCHSPVGAHAIVDGDKLRLLGMAATEDGCVLCRAADEGPASDAVRVGRNLGSKLARRLGQSPEPLSGTHYTEP
jgi:hydroxymethylbilane synthase